VGEGAEETALCPQAVSVNAIKRPDRHTFPPFLFLFMQKTSFLTREKNTADNRLSPQVMLRFGFKFKKGHNTLFFRHFTIPSED